MNVFNIVNFILICLVGVILYMIIKEKEDAIEELYDMYYELYDVGKNKKEEKKREKVFNIGKRIS